MAPSSSERRPLAALRLHERAGLVPEMSTSEFALLLEDVREHGIEDPLDVTAAGVVLDGRHRLRAAQELGYADVPVRRVSPADEIEHMVRAALVRRNMSASQRAALVVGFEEHRARLAEGLARRRANLKGRADVATLPHRGERSREVAARLADVSPRLIQDAQKVMEGDPALFEAVKAGSLPVHRAAKQLERKATYAALPLVAAPPRGPFEVIYADPAWPSSSPGSAWAPEQHYPTMTLAEIKALTLDAAEDAILYLWVVNALLSEGLEVLEVWGFTYKTNLVWVKDSIGLGNWTRNRHELLLLGTRGRFPLPDEPVRPDSVIEARRGRHSEKPASVYELIERAYPRASKLELFARDTRPGWAAWGNEVAA